MTTTELCDECGEAIARVECVETVPLTHPFDDTETPPIWRVIVGEYCADFDFEQAARSFAGAINSALSPAPDADTVMVPRDCTDEIAEAIALEVNCCGGVAETIWRKALAASQVKPDPLPEIPEGMKAWHGDDSAPEDWDGGPVLGEDGAFYDPPVEWCKPSGGPDVAAYRPVVHGHVNPIVAAYTPRPLPSPELGEVQ